LEPPRRGSPARAPTFFREVQIPDFTAGVRPWCDGSVGGMTPTTNKQEDLMRGHAVVATLLVASLHAQTLAKEGSVDWAMNATIIDGCSCRLLCPCIFGSPATVGSAATHEHRGHRACHFNAAFRVNKGHYDGVRLDGLKFWFAGDKGDARTVELTFEPSATKEQREGIREFLFHFLPLRWESFTEGPDAKIEWKAGAVRAEARLDGGRAAEVVLTRYSGATGEGTTVIRNMSYFAATRNDGFNVLPVDIVAYRRGPKPAPFEFRGTSGWTITIDMNSKDVSAARQ
jgi:Protein of unknown function (DUF1326)